MKLGFMGTQGTGKSTLLERFLKDNPHYTRSVNIQRILKSKYDLDINGGADYETQFAISAHYASEVCAYDNYISDRTVLDTFVYADTCHKITLEQLDYIKSIFEKAVCEYDVIFYLPIEFVPPEDGVRVVDDSYRLKVDSLMQIYRNKHSSLITELRGSIEERYYKMMSVLKASKALEAK